MGKYNFSAMKFDEIERRISELEIRAAKSETENRKLKEENQRLKEKTRQVRDLAHEIEDYSKLQALFGFDIADGVLITTDSRTKINANFQTFYTNILRALKPIARKNDPKKDSYRITGTPQKDLSDAEWKITVEAVNAIIDTICYAKKKMSDAAPAEAATNETL